MYCDGNAQAKSLKFNQKATDIAKACGYSELRV